MTQATGEPSVLVDVILSVHNGATYLGAMLDSLVAQTHPTWRLWMRDDGSTDGTRDVMRRAADADPRIVVLASGEGRLGAARSFGWLLDRVPANSAYVMCADHDDVWLPGKIAATLAVMRRAEREAPGPVLVHTDLVVVDDALRPIAPSFWRFSGVAPEPVSLRRLVVQNVVTGPTMMLNRALRELAGSVPAAAIYQDWWYSLVAAAFGRIVALPEATTLYRQHGANSVGARRDVPLRWFELPSLARDALGRTEHLRSEIARTTRQAGAFLERYRARLREDEREFLQAYARIPEHSLLRRKLAVARLRLRLEHGFWRNLGIFLRA